MASELENEMINQENTDIDEYMEQRLKHLEELKEKGISPFGGRFERTHLIKDVLELCANLEENQEGPEVTIAGRLMALREHGKASFGDLNDVTDTIQVYFKQNQVGADKYSLLKLVDIGDFLGVRGKVFKTRRGEITVFVDDFTFLTKALRTPPEKYHGLKDVELRYRRRYVDLLSNPDVRNLFINRSKIISSIKFYLESRGFYEVETPAMALIAGGATARPFVTHHNALDMELFFRIATELYLKRCIVGGMEKVFEIGRIFRNEGIDTKHNPEFTMLELYWAYADYTDMMEITEGIINECCKVLGNYEVEIEGRKINLKPPFERISMEEAYRKYAGIEMKKLNDPAYAKEMIKKYHIMKVNKIY
jgi:lysyl-tRNA synthetase class 2